MMKSMGKSHSSQQIAVASLLMNLQAEMARLSLWESTKPPIDALQSTQPFCIDTLNFSQWIQFIFIQRLHAMIENQTPLPTQSNVAAMAEEYFRGQQIDAASIISLLEDIDRSLVKC